MQTFVDLTFEDHAVEGVDPGYREPWIIPSHIDGPLLHFSDGQLHWLTVWERIQFYFGRTDATKLQHKLRPRLSAEIRYYRGDPIKGMGNACIPTETT